MSRYDWFAIGTLVGSGLTTFAFVFVTHRWPDLLCGKSTPEEEEGSDDRAADPQRPR